MPVNRTRDYEAARIEGDYRSKVLLRNGWGVTFVHDQGFNSYWGYFRIMRDVDGKWMRLDDPITLDQAWESQMEHWEE